MSRTLPVDIDAALQPLWSARPISLAMDQLVVTTGAGTPPEVARLVDDLVKEPAIAARPALVAGLWLYVDDLDRSHTVSQNIPDVTGSFWHGIMHRREGDFSNSHYWFRKVGRHPAMNRIADYDPHRFIDEVAAAQAEGKSPADLVDLQRREWLTLFAWCAAQR